MAKLTWLFPGDDMRTSIPHDLAYASELSRDGDLVRISGGAAPVWSARPARCAIFTALDSKSGRFLGYIVAEGTQTATTYGRLYRNQSLSELIKLAETTSTGTTTGASL